MDNQNEYFVRLTIRTGEYEKVGRHVVSADNKEEAATRACERESHYKDAGWDKDNRWWEDGFEMLYREKEVTLLTEEEAKVLKKFM